MKKNILTIILVNTSICFTIVAQSNNDEKLTRKIDSLVALQHSEGEPGGAIGILSKEKVVLAKGYGLMNVDLNRPIDKNTTFDIASVSISIF